MRSLLTRAAQHNKGHRLTPVAFAILAAAVIVIFNSALGNAAYRAPDNGITTGSLPPALPLANSKKHMRHAEEGNEGLDLAARLTEEGGFITRPVTWKIFERDAHLGTIGKSVYNNKTPIVDLPLTPGSYRIEVIYGHTSLIRDVNILPQTRITITFILNVGGVRTLSKVAGMDASHYSGARHAIFAMHDNKPEKLITDKVAQGQIARLAAGHYRIESRFDNGNTVATAFVTVKPGILTSLTIDHQAALARFAFHTKSEKVTNWQIKSQNGDWSKTGKNKNPAMILAPGSYTFTAQIGANNFRRQLSLSSGKATTIVVGK